MTPSEVATRFGLRPSHGDWRGTCPICDYPAAFIVRRGADGSARPWCACCRDTAGLMRLIGSNRYRPHHDTQAAVASAAVADRAAQQRDAALAMWRGAVPLDAREAAPARAYLKHRRLPHLVVCERLRFRPDATHPDGGRRMAMLALVADHAGASVAVQRTYLTPAGEKADPERPRATKGSYIGACIWIAPPAPAIVIGEGLESSASAGVLLGRPAAAAISANNLAGSLILPPVVRDIIIAADADKPGITAAAAAAGRWQAEGRRVRIAKPDKPGSDFNDLLLERPNG